LIAGKVFRSLDMEQQPTNTKKGMKPPRKKNNDINLLSSVPEKKGVFLK
jgi:hypothetical protein